MANPVAETSAANQSVRVSSYLFISALLSLSTWMLLLLPNFLQDRDWSSVGIGWAIGSFFLFNLIFQTVTGQIVNRYSSVPTALAGTALAGLGAVFYFSSWWVSALIFPARILHGIGSAMISAGALIQLLQSVPAHLKGRMLGYFGLPGFVMLGMGPLLAEWLVAEWGFRGTFASLLVIFAAIAWLLSRLPRPLAPKGTIRQPFFQVLRVTMPSLNPILLFSILFGLCFAAWNSFLAPAVAALGAGAVSSFSFGYGSGAVASRLGISPALEKPHRRLLGISTLISYGVALMFIPLAFSSWHLLVIGLVCGLSHGTYYPSLSSLASERFHPLHTAQAMSLYLSASSLGMFVGPPIWGAVTDLFDLNVTFAASGLLLVLGTILFLLYEKKNRGLVSEPPAPIQETGPAPVEEAPPSEPAPGPPGQERQTDEEETLQDLSEDWPAPKT